MGSDMFQLVTGVITEIACIGVAFSYHKSNRTVNSHRSTDYMTRNTTRNMRTLMQISPKGTMVIQKC